MQSDAERPETSEEQENEAVERVSGVVMLVLGAGQKGGCGDVEGTTYGRALVSAVKTSTAREVYILDNMFAILRAREVSRRVGLKNKGV